MRLPMWTVVVCVACSEPNATRGTTVVLSALPRGEPAGVDTSRPAHDALVGVWPEGADGLGAPVPRDPSPPIGASFVGLPYNAAGLPPDTMGAVGPAHVMVTLNSEVRVQTKAGAVLSTVSLATFWAPTGAAAPFDPSVAWHPGLSRWLTIAVSNKRTAQASLLIGISQTNDPTGAWNLFRIDGDAADATWPDYPRLGFNAQWAVVSANMFGNATGAPFSQSKVWVFPLADLLANVATPTVHTAPFITMVPAQMLDPGENELVLAATANTPGGIGVALPRLTGSVNSSTLTTSTAAVRFPSPLPFSFAVVPAPQLGSSTRVDGITFNSSETQTAVARNGRLYLAHQVGLPQVSPTRTSLQWWDIDLVASRVVGVGRVDDPTAVRAYSHPALAVNRAGDVLLGFTRFGTDVFPSAAFAVHLANDPPGVLRDEVVFKAGEAAYTRPAPTVVRWGDYSAAAVDPTDDCTLWTLQEYAAPANTWGTWWAQVPMPDQPLVLRVPPVAAVPEDSAPSSALVTALSRVVGCVRPASPLVVSAVAQTPTLVAVDAGAPQGSLAPVSWQLASDLNGPAVVRVTLTDGAGSTTADLAFTVTEVNDAPVATPDSPSVVEDTPTGLAVTSNDLAGPPNESGQALRITSVPATSAQGGALSVDGGLVWYLPPADYAGPDSFTYTVADDGTTNGVPAPLTATATVTLSVAQVNDPPRLAPVQATTMEDVALTLPASSTFSGTPGPANEASQVLSLSSVVALSDAGGLVVLDGGSLEYTPPADFSGLDRLTVWVTDDGAPPALRAGSLEVTVTPVNDPPLAQADQFVQNEDQVVFIPFTLLLLNDSAGPGERQQGLRVLAVDQTTDAGAVLTLVDAGVLVRGLADFNGADEFGYRVIDDGVPALEAASVVRVTFREVNDAPVGVDDTVTAPARQPLVLPAAMLLANDAPGPANERGQTLSLASVAPMSARGGDVTLVGTSVTYRAPAGFSGEDSFTYVLSDDGTTGGLIAPQTATATVHVFVTDVNAAPVATDDDVTSAEDTEAVLRVLANDVAGPAFESSQRLRLVQVSPQSEQGGTVSIDGDTLRYRPAPDFNGVDRFTYRVSDDGLTNGAPDPQGAQATVTVRVTAVNDPPVAGADVATMTQGATLSVPVEALLSNDVAGPLDERAQHLSLVDVVGARLTNGVLEVTPEPSFSGTLTITATLTDDGVSDGRPDPRQAPAELTVTVTPTAKAKGCACDGADGGLVLPLVVLLAARRRAARGVRASS